MAPFMYRDLTEGEYLHMVKCATDVVQWRADERVFIGDAPSPVRPTYQGTLPLRSWKVPVGPSGGRVARRTMASVPSATVCVPRLLLKSVPVKPGVGGVHEDAGQGSRVL